jgi:hypothetical protein
MVPDVIVVRNQVGVNCATDLDALLRQAMMPRSARHRTGDQMLPGCYLVSFRSKTH